MARLCEAYIQVTIERENIERERDRKRVSNDATCRRVDQKKYLGHHGRLAFISLFSSFGGLGDGFLFSQFY